MIYRFYGNPMGKDISKKIDKKRECCSVGWWVYAKGPWKGLSLRWPWAMQWAVSANVPQHATRLLCVIRTNLFWCIVGHGKLRVGWGMVMFRIEQTNGSQTVDRAWLSLKRFLPCSWTTWPRCIQKVRDNCRLMLQKSQYRRLNFWMKNECFTHRRAPWRVARVVCVSA